MCVVSILVGWEIEPCLLWRKLLESHEPERPEYFFVFLDFWLLFSPLMMTIARMKWPCAWPTTQPTRKGQSHFRDNCAMASTQILQVGENTWSKFFDEGPLLGILEYQYGMGFSCFVGFLTYLIQPKINVVVFDCTMTDQSVLLWCFAGFTLLWQDHNIAGSVPRKWWAPFRAWKLKLKTLL